MSPPGSSFVLDLIDHFKEEGDVEAWEKAHGYRQTFLDNILEDQLFLSKMGVDWESSDHMPVADRTYAVQRFTEIAQKEAGH